MRRVLLFVLFLLVGFCAEAQWTAITTTSLTATVGDNRVQVTRTGRVGTHSCHEAGPYMIGRENGGTQGAGSYIWEFCEPVDSIQVYIGALQNGDDVSILINGDPYAVDISNLHLWVDCGALSSTVSSGIIVDPSPIGEASSTRFIVTASDVGEYIKQIEVHSASAAGREGIDASMAFANTQHYGPISGIDTICLGASATFTHSATTGAWSSSNTGVATVGSSTGVVTGVAYGTAIITYTLPVGCIFTHSVAVLPSTIRGILQICLGQTTNLDADPTGGTWSSSNTAIGSVDADGIVTGVSIGTATISYLIGTGCLATVDVTVIPSPAAITGVAHVCLHETTTLFHSIPGGTWSSSSGNTIGSVDAAGVVYGVAVGTDVITYIVPGIGCYATIPFTVYDIPSAISGITSICAGRTTSLTCTPTGGAWSSSAPGIASVDATTGVVIGYSPGTAIITYSAPGDCRITTLVTVNPLPDYPIQKSDLCVGETLEFSTTPPGGTWISSDPAIGSFSGGVLTGVSVGTLVVTYILPTGCYITIPTTVHLTPTFTGPYSVCLGYTTTLTGTPAGGTWLSSGPAIAPVGSTSGVVTGVGLGVVTITYALSTGCSAFHTFTVNPNPDIIGGTEVCYLSTILLNATMPGGLWSSSNDVVATVGSTTGVVTGGLGGTATITYTLPTGCYATHTVTVRGADPITGPLYVCVGATTTLSCTPLGGTWSAGSTTVLTIGSTTGIVTGVTAGTATITYITTLSPDCLGMAITTFTVAPIPELHPNRAKVLCAPITLDAGGPSGGGTVSGGPDYTYTWSPSTGLSATTGSSVVCTGPLPPGAMTVYTITCTSSFGCVAIAYDTVFTMCDSQSCHDMGDVEIIPIGGTIGGVGITTTISPGAYYMYADINFIGNIEMNGAVVAILPGLKMTVEEHSRMNVEASHLYCCSKTQLWEGITLASDVTASSAIFHIGKQSIVEDAKVAVYMPDGVPRFGGICANCYDSLMFVSNGTIFNRNIVGISVLRFPSLGITPPEPPSRYPIIIHNSVFTSRDLSLFASGSDHYPMVWPATTGTATCMKYNTSWAPATALLPPFNVDNPDAGGAGIPYRFVACKNSELADIGIYLRYVGGFVSSNYSEIVVGDSTVVPERTTLNLFDSLHFGIMDSFSNLACYNNAFSHMYPRRMSTPLTSGGVYCLAPQTMVLSGGLSRHARNRVQILSINPLAASERITNNLFYDCPVGVLVADFHTVKGQSAQMFSYHGHTGASIVGGYAGYIVAARRALDINIRHNELTNIWRTGIMVSMATEGYGDITVHRNTINSELGGVAPPSSQFVNQAIMISNIAGAPGSISKRVRVKQNNLNYVRNGIWVDNFGKQRPRTDSNIVILNNYDTATVQRYGIRHSNNFGDTIIDNQVYGPGSDVPYILPSAYGVGGVILGYYDNAIVGIYSASSSLTMVSCNLVDSTNTGFQFYGQLARSIWANNTMKENAFGVVLRGVIAQQGTPTVPSDNVWVGPMGWWEPLSIRYTTFTLAITTPSLSPLYTRDIFWGAAIYDPPNNWGNPFTPSTLLYGTGGRITNGLYPFATTAPTPECSNPWLPNHMRPLHAAAKRDMGYTYAEPTNSWMAQMSLYKELTMDSLLADSSDTLAQFWSMASGSRYAWLNSIEHALADEDTASAAALLTTSIDADTTTAYDTTTGVWMADDALADTIIQHYITVYKLHLRYLRETMSHADSCEVTSLANLCPIRDGAAIYAARTLYRLIYNDGENFNDNCNDSVGMAPCDTCGWMGRYASPGKHPKSVIKSSSKTNNYTLFPNPNKGSFTLTHNVAEEQNVNVAVLDAVGREVYNQVLMFTDSKVDVVLSNIPSGLYILVVTDSHGEKSKFKFVISK